MKATISHVLAVATLAHAIPLIWNGDSEGTPMDAERNITYSLPMFDPNQTARIAEITENRKGFIYGPSLIGNSSFFPIGPKGEELSRSEVVLWNSDAAPQRAAVRAEAVPVRQSLEAVSASGVRTGL